MDRCLNFSNGDRRGAPNLTFERETVRQSKAGVFFLCLTGGVDRTALVLILEIGHFTAEQRHETAKNERLGKQIQAEWIVRVEHSRDRHTR